MESFFNFVWLALAVGLVCAWAMAHWSPARITREDWGRQAIAMGALLLVLLPVISLTDDLQAWAAPAETEHGLRQPDVSPRTDHALPPLWFHAVRGILSPALQAWNRLDLAQHASTPHRAETSPVENRPPPSLC